MRQGIKDVLIYYAVGIVVSIIAFLVIGVPLGHGRGEYALAVPVLISVISFFWIIFVIIKGFETSYTQRIKDQIWTHAITIMLIVIALSFF